MAEQVMTYEGRDGLAYFFNERRGETGTDMANLILAAPAAAEVEALAEGADRLQRSAAVKRHAKTTLRTEGYTDGAGRSPYNESLSDWRAKTEADTFGSQGIERSRLTEAGFGADKPVDTKATAQGNADHRRVEHFSQQ